MASSQDKKKTSGSCVETPEAPAWLSKLESQSEKVSEYMSFPCSLAPVDLGHVDPDGSDAARKRRAQLQTQLPPHDVAPAVRQHASDLEKSEHTKCPHQMLAQRRFINDNRGALLDWVNSSITYTGFDAVAMRNKLLRILTGNLILMGVLIGLVRGNNIDRIKDTMRSKTARSQFNDLIKSAKIKKNIGGDYGAVTLSRMLACFPEVVAETLYTQEKLPMAIDISVLRNIHPEYPSVARHQVIACIIPNEIDSESVAKILDVIVVPYLLTSEQINQKNGEWKKKNAKKRATESMSFLQKSFHSKVILESERMELAKKYGIITSHNNTLTSTWAGVAAKAKKWLNDKYGVNHQDSLED